MVVTRDNQIHKNRNLKVENYCFKKVQRFKYFGVDINSHHNYYQEEIILRIKGGNRC